MAGNILLGSASKDYTLFMASDLVKRLLPVGCLICFRGQVLHRLYKGASLVSVREDSQRDNMIFRKRHSSVPEVTKPKRILVAEDCPDSRVLLLKLLEKLDVEVLTVSNGQEAVDSALYAAKSKQPFDLLVMDVHMPGMSGPDALKALRSQGVEAPVVSISSGAKGNEERAAYEAGCSEHISKLAGREYILARLQSWLA